MPYKSEKLKARIVERYGEQKRFAEALGTSESTLSRYLCGKDWKGNLMFKAIRLLEIPESEIDAYFFEPMVAKSKPRRRKA